MSYHRCFIMTFVIDLCDLRKMRSVILLLILILIGGLIFLGYFCPDKMCALQSGPPTPPYMLDAKQNRYTQYEPMFSVHDLDRHHDFSIDGDTDVLVFLHIQKTGGTTLGKHLVRNIELKRACSCQTGRKRCDCLNQHDHYWLFSRYSTGWSCGLHADWTELKSCVSDALDKKEGLHRERRFFYISILREPIQRYISEWKHSQRGSTWMSAQLKCNGRQATLSEVPFCFTGKDWTGVSIKEFTSCESNLAHNRQTRMLANLSLIHCYNDSFASQEDRNQLMLQSAKDNLLHMDFFGLTEYQEETQYLFEHTFGLKFIESFVQHNITHANQVNLSPWEMEQIKRRNTLDIELYNYAKNLFLQRFNFSFTNGNS